MSNKSFTTAIEVSNTPEEVFNCLRQVSKWWSTDYTGNSADLNDEFVINHPGKHYSKQKLVEFIPNKKIVWLVTDSTLNWLTKDPHEWTNTKMIFELSTAKGKTLLHFTHEGLAPDKECYNQCQAGWTMVIKERLYNFITTGKTIE